MIIGAASEYREKSRRLVEIRSNYAEMIDVPEDEARHIYDIMQFGSGEYEALIHRIDFKVNLGLIRNESVLALCTEARELASWLVDYHR